MFSEKGSAFLRTSPPVVLLPFSQNPSVSDSTLDVAMAKGVTMVEAGVEAGSVPKWERSGYPHPGCFFVTGLFTSQKDGGNL